MAFTRALFLAALVAAASAARPVSEAAPAAAAAPQQAMPAAADTAQAQAVYARAIEVSNADRAAAAPIISFLKQIPQPPGESRRGRGGGERGSKKRRETIAARARRARLTSRSGCLVPAGGARPPSGARAHTPRGGGETCCCPCLVAEWP
jgi:hypothetical protein